MGDVIFELKLSQDGKYVMLDQCDPRVRQLLIAKFTEAASKAEVSNSARLYGHAEELPHTNAFALNNIKGDDKLPGFVGDDNKITITNDELIKLIPNERRKQDLEALAKQLDTYISLRDTSTSTQPGHKLPFTGLFSTTKNKSRTANVQFATKLRDELRAAPESGLVSKDNGSEFNKLTRILNTHVKRNRLGGFIEKVYDTVGNITGRRTIRSDDLNKIIQKIADYHDKEAASLKSKKSGNRKPRGN